MNPQPPRTSGLILRSAFGGVLMGLANLVPGISGGTMLLAAGIYDRFITAIADLSVLRFTRQAVLILSVVVIAGAAAILLGATVVKDLVVNHRWIMYSLFIGLTLGGVPVILRLLPNLARASIWLAAAVGFGIMAAVTQISPDSAGAQGGYLLMFVGGIAGAAAMILPGISGAYLLLVLGIYVPLLAAISLFKEGCLTALSSESGGFAAGWPMILESWHVGIPVGLGLLVGILFVSNLLKWLLKRCPDATHGFLLGLLLGSVLGLWPFQQPVQPVVGEIIKGQAVTAETLALIPAEDWRLERFTPTPAQIGIALALIVVGFAATLVIARFGREKPHTVSSTP